MLLEYFALRIEEDGCLHSVPSILLGHEPELDELPQFLWNLATKVGGSVAGLVEWDLGWLVAQSVGEFIG